MIDRIATELPLKAVEAVEAGVRTVWSDGRESFFHSIWLRDNCYCGQCGDATIGRRTTRLTDIALTISADTVCIDDTGSLSISWSDGHKSCFDNGWLQTHAYDDKSRCSRSFSSLLWNDEFRKAPVRVQYLDVLDDDCAFLEMLHDVRDHGICFLDNVPLDPDALEQLARRIGPPQESNFGRIQDLIVDRSKRSIANDVAALKPHTDEPYRASPPGLLMFHCLETDITDGGGSIFLDGFEIAETLRSEDPEAFDSLTRNRQAFRRHFAGDVNLITEFPVISLDEFGHINGVRINDRVGAPLSIPSHEVPQYYRGMRRLLSLSEDPARCIVKILRPGDAVIFDNHRVLHGRTALTITGRRWLRWIQVKRGDFHSTLRITAEKLAVPSDLRPLHRGAYG